MTNFDRFFSKFSEKILENFDCWPLFRNFPKKFWKILIIDPFFQNFPKGRNEIVLEFRFEKSDRNEMAYFDQFRNTMVISMNKIVLQQEVTEES